MKTIQRRSSSYHFLLIGLLASILMVSVLLNAAVPGFSGQITAIENVPQRIIEIDGNQYIIANDAMIFHETNEGISSITLGQLRQGHAVYFTIDDREVIIRIHVFEGDFDFPEN